MLEFPSRKKPIENPNKQIIDDCKFVDDCFDNINISNGESETESNRSSRINYLNVSSKESIHSAMICGNLSRRQSTERYNTDAEQVAPLSSREKEEIEKHFGSFHKPSTISIISHKNQTTESSENEVIQVETSTASPTKNKNKIKKKNIQSLSDWSYLSNITNIQTKIISTITEIKKGLSTEFPEIDGIVELERIQKRSLEFLTRFSRQYLYEIGRQIQGLTANNIVEKIYGIFNLILQALQSYLKNVGRIIGNLFYEKLKILLNFNIKLSEICLLKKLFHENDYFIEKMFEQSYRLITFVENILINKTEVIKSKKLNEPKKILSVERFSMYGMNSRENDRTSSSRIQKQQRSIKQNFIQKNIKTSSTNPRKLISSHRIVSSKSVAKCSPPLESLKLDHEELVTMMNSVKMTEEKIVSFFFFK